MRVAKWGNSLAVRLPAVVVEALDLKEGDEVDIQVTDRREFGVAKKRTRKEIVEGLAKYQGMIPADIKFDRDEANAR